MTSKVRVFLVEDSEDDRLIVRDVLAQKGGYHLRWAADFSSALESLQTESCDVILLDRGLPDIQGVESIQKLKTIFPLIPIVILTGLEDEMEGLKAIHEGAQDYLMKQGLTASLLTRSLRYAIERKHLEEKLKEALRIKSDFISVVSHELRTPLAIIKESVAIVEDGSAGPINPEQKKFLNNSKRSTDRLTRLINDVLDFQKLRSGKPVVQSTENDLNRLAEEIQEDFAPTLRNKKLQLILDLDPNLPRIFCDRDKIIQVLTNLVGNAVRVTEKGKITLKTQLLKQAVRVSVEDHGPGIREEDFPKLFIAFSQLTSEQERVQGSTGLGLALSKEIVEAHGGTIGVESVYGQGATFYFDLPYDKSLPRGGSHG